MADTTKVYISTVTLPSGTSYDIKDAEARELISNLQNFAASGVSYVGTTTTALSDGATTNPITVNDADYTATSGDMVNYNNVMYAWNGTQWDQLGSAGALKALAYKDSVTATYKPTGSIGTQLFTGTEGTVSVSGTAAGTVGAPTFHGTEGSVSVSGTVAASNATVTTAAPGTSETANYTPAGTVTLTPTTTSVKQVATAGTPSKLTMTVADENLTFGWTEGTATTTSDVSALTGATASFEGTGTVIKASVDSQTVSSSGKFTPAGSNDAPTFTGGTVTSTGTFTPAGKVGQATFTGDQVTITSD